jgi:uroporphyrin-III C-methyltransferase/precorrin-2 dehydrogenase/sirohydrochlorin ferrochelatase/uroporphyrin-III C-methyltransferase
MTDTNLLAMKDFFEGDQSTPLAPGGCVSLVGAGPGDPELLTLRAYRRIVVADVVLYDNLVSPDVLALINPQAEKRYVGKKAAKHALPQSDVNQCLIDLARSGKRVVRLKGGDPFIFGRGGEELEALLAASVQVEVIPGITAAIGCAAYAGIPLTHRDWAQSVTFATGHLKQGLSELDWPALARPTQTVVFYMGMTAAAGIAEALMSHGRMPDTPVAVIYHGTRPDQKVAITTLKRLPDTIQAETIKPPALLIVGDVVRLYRPSSSKT